MNKTLRSAEKKKKTTTVSELSLKTTVFFRTHLCLIRVGKGSTALQPYKIQKANHIMITLNSLALLTLTILDLKN